MWKVATATHIRHLAGPALGLALVGCTMEDKGLTESNRTASDPGQPVALVEGTLDEAEADFAVLVQGKDMDHFNSLAGWQVVGNSIDVWTTGLPHGGDVGFDIPDSFRRTDRRIRFNFVVYEGKAKMALDLFGTSTIEETQYFQAGHDGLVSAIWFIPVSGDLKAVLRLAPDSRVRVFMGSIE